MHGWNHSIDPPVVGRMLVNELPLERLLSQDRPHNVVDGGNKAPALFLGLKATSGVVDVEEDAVVR